MSAMRNVPVATAEELDALLMTDSLPDVRPASIGRTTYSGSRAAKGAILPMLGGAASGDAGAVPQEGERHDHLQR